MPRRPYLDMIEIRRIVARPDRRTLQPDGRIRVHGWSESAAGWLRVVLLPDGETVHNAFLDEDVGP